VVTARQGNVWIPAPGWARPTTWSIDDNWTGVALLSLVREFLKLAEDRAKLPRTLIDLNGSRRVMSSEQDEYCAFAR